MKKAIVLYDTKYGNTKSVAEAVSEGIRGAGVECVVMKIEEIHTLELANFDLIVFGCPNHNQAPSLTMQKYIDRVAAVPISGKSVAAFDTYTGLNKGIALKKLEAHIKDKLRGVFLVAPGFSARVKSRTGPVAEEDLPKAKNFGLEIAKKTSN